MVHCLPPQSCTLVLMAYWFALCNSRQNDCTFCSCAILFHRLDIVAPDVFSTCSKTCSSCLYVGIWSLLSVILIRARAFTFLLYTALSSSFTFSFRISTLVSPVRRHTSNVLSRVSLQASTKIVRVLSLCT